MVIESGVMVILSISYINTEYMGPYDKDSTHTILKGRLACVRVIEITMQEVEIQCKH